MEWLGDTPALRAWRAGLPAGARVGFVPTMGFLHAGHASLMALLRPRVDALLVSIYVNPLQFGPSEDLDRYPRDAEGDAALCRAEGVDAVFAPASLYAPDFSTVVRVDGLTDGLCGASRPTHFQGVTTVVARLFGLTGAHVAAFGEKDYQQLAVIRRMVADLALPVEIVGGPIVRDEGGLALSSRNAYLSDPDRRRARTLRAALRALQAAYDAGERDVDALRAVARAHVDADRLDYLEVVDAASLRALHRVEGPARALIAAFYGATRLIDNVDVAAGAGAP
jgi:pantoate--beta-alanine ligase